MRTTPDTDPPLRHALKRAVAWRTLAELVKRHPEHDLRIVETHPCGGQYDCLTLVRWPSHDEVCTMNIPGTGLALGAALGPRRPGPNWADDLGSHTWRYPQHALGEDRAGLARAVEAALGRPDPGDRPPKSSPNHIALAVIGEVLDRHALGDRRVDLRNGWYEESGARPWARSLPAVAAAHPGGELQEQQAAIRYWALDRTVNPSAPAVIVDVASSAVWLRGKAQASLAARFAQGAGVRALAWWLEEALDG